MLQINNFALLTKTLFNRKSVKVAKYLQDIEDNYPDDGVDAENS